MRKLILVNPHPVGNVGEENVSVLNQMPVNLGYLKTLTPDGWEVDIIDEVMELVIDEETGELNFPDADLVGITAVSYQAQRAYDIAAAYREKNIPVIMGGVHATCFPEEVSKYVDSVVSREGITVWPQVIKDFENNCLKPIYEGGLTPLSEYKNILPARDFLKEKYKYRYSGIITTAGCPFHCDFCSVPQIQGKKYRERPVEDVLDEFEAIQGKFRGLILTDENFYGHSKKSNERVKELFKGMVDRGIYQNWFGFTSFNIYQDDEVLDYMVRSGCVGVLIGIESVNKDTLETMNKNVNLRISIEKYYEAIANIRKHGIAVWGTMVFGNDNDTASIFKESVDFVLEADLDIMTCGILCPFIYSNLYNRFNSEGRIFRNNYPQDWKYYTSAHLTYILKNMTLQELIDGFEYVYDRIYSTPVLRERFRSAKTLLNNDNAAMFGFKANLDWQTVFKHLVDNLKELRDSGDYERALEKYNAGELNGTKVSET